MSKEAPFPKKALVVRSAQWPPSLQALVRAQSPARSPVAYHPFRFILLTRVPLASKCDVGSCGLRNVMWVPPSCGASRGCPPPVAFVRRSVHRCRLYGQAGPCPHLKLPGAPTYNPKGLVKAPYFYSFGDGFSAERWPALRDSAQQGTERQVEHGRDRTQGAQGERETDANGRRPS